MKCHQRLYDNCMESFMDWIEICVVIYICNLMHKTFMQLKNNYIQYIWTLKFAYLSNNKLYGFVFQ